MTGETIEKLVIQIQADIDKAQRDLKKVQGSLGDIGDESTKAGNKVQKSGQKIGAVLRSMKIYAVAAAAALGAVGYKAISAAGNFEQAITNAATVTGLSGEAFEQAKVDMEELAVTLGEKTAFTATEVANAMYDLASAGYDVAHMSEDELKPILDIAAATQSDLTVATETTTSALGQFGLGMEDSARVADTMAATISNSKANIDKLTISLRQVGPVANSMGMEIEDVNALLGQLYNAGLTGELAGTGLKTALASLVDPSTEAQEAIESMGLTLDDVNPNTMDFIDILENLRRAGITNQQTMQIFGREGAASINALLNNTQGIRELEETIRAAGGAADDMATKQLDAFNGQLKILKGNLDTVMVSAGQPAMEDLTQTMIDFNEWGTSGGYDQMVEGIGDVASALATVADAGASAIQVLTDLYTTVSSQQYDVPEGLQMTNSGMPDSFTIGVVPNFDLSTISSEYDTIQEQLNEIKQTNKDITSEVETQTQALSNQSTKIPSWAGHSDYIREQLAATGTKNIGELMAIGGTSTVPNIQSLQPSISSTAVQSSGQNNTIVEKLTELITIVSQEPRQVDLDADIEIRNYADINDLARKVAEILQRDITYGGSK